MQKKRQKKTGKRIKQNSIFYNSFILTLLHPQILKWYVLKNNFEWVCSQQCKNFLNFIWKVIKFQNRVYAIRGSWIDFLPNGRSKATFQNKLLCFDRPYYYFNVGGAVEQNNTLQKRQKILFPFFKLIFPKRASLLPCIPYYDN